MTTLGSGHTRVGWSYIEHIAKRPVGIPPERDSLYLSSVKEMLSILSLERFSSPSPEGHKVVSNVVEPTAVKRKGFSHLLGDMEKLLRAIKRTVA